MKNHLYKNPIKFKDVCKSKKGLKLSFVKIQRENRKGRSYEPDNPNPNQLH